MQSPQDGYTREEKLVLQALADSTLEQLRHGMTKVPQVLVNVRIAEQVDCLDHPDVKNAVQAVEAELGAEGRVLLRASGTEPVIRVMVEGIDHQHIRRHADCNARRAVEQHIGYFKPMPYRVNTLVW